MANESLDIITRFIVDESGLLKAIASQDKLTAAQINASAKVQAAQVAATGKVEAARVSADQKETARIAKEDQQRQKSVKVQVQTVEQGEKQIADVRLRYAKDSGEKIIADIHAGQQKQLAQRIQFEQDAGKRELAIMKSIALEKQAVQTGGIGAIAGILGTGRTVAGIDVGRTLSSIGIKSVGAAAGIGLAATALYKLSEAGTKWTQEQRQIIVGFQQLGFGYDLSKKAAAETSATLESLAHEYAVDISQLKEAEGRYLSMGGSVGKLDEKMRAIIVLSRQTGLGMEEIASTLVKGTMSSELAARGFQQMGIAIDKNSTQQERWNAVFERVKPLLGATSLQSHDFDQEMRRMSNDSSEFFGKIGAATNVGWRGLLVGLTDAFTGTTLAQREYSRAMEEANRVADPEVALAIKIKSGQDELRETMDQRRKNLDDVIKKHEKEKEDAKKRESEAKAAREKARTDFIANQEIEFNAFDHNLRLKGLTEEEKEKERLAKHIELQEKLVEYDKNRDKKNYSESLKALDAHLDERDKKESDAKERALKRAEETAKKIQEFENFSYDEGVKFQNDRLKADGKFYELQAEAEKINRDLKIDAIDDPINHAIAKRQTDLDDLATDYKVRFALAVNDKVERLALENVYDAKVAAIKTKSDRDLREISKKKNEEENKFVTTVADGAKRAWDLVNKQFFGKVEKALNAENDVAGAFLSGIVEKTAQLGEEQIAKGLVKGLSGIVDSNEGENPMLGPARPAHLDIIGYELPKHIDPLKDSIDILNQTIITFGDKFAGMNGLHEKPTEEIFQGPVVGAAWGGWHAEGLDADISSPTIIGVGEKGTEHVTVTNNQQNAKLQSLIDAQSDKYSNSIAHTALGDVSYGVLEQKGKSYAEAIAGGFENGVDEKKGQFAIGRGVDSGAHIAEKGIIRGAEVGGEREIGVGVERGIVKELEIQAEKSAANATEKILIRGAGKGILVGGGKILTKALVKNGLNIAGFLIFPDDLQAGQLSDQEREWGANAQREMFGGFSAHSPTTPDIHGSRVPVPDVVFPVEEPEATITITGIKVSDSAIADASKGFKPIIETANVAGDHIANNIVDPIKDSSQEAAANLSKVSSGILGIGSAIKKGGKNEFSNILASVGGMLPFPFNLVGGFLGGLGSLLGFADGGEMVTNKPTLFMTSERGHMEHVKVTPGPKSPTMNYNSPMGNGGNSSQEMRELIDAVKTMKIGYMYNGNNARNWNASARSNQKIATL